MKKLLLGLTILASLTSFASSYENSGYCSDMKALNMQEFRILSSADNIDDIDAAKRLEVVMKIGQTVSQACPIYEVSSLEAENYCDEVKKITKKEFQIASSAENIDDINAAKTTNAIIAIEGLLREICD